MFDDTPCYCGFIPYNIIPFLTAFLNLENHLEETDTIVQVDHVSRLKNKSKL